MNSIVSSCPGSIVLVEIPSPSIVRLCGRVFLLWKFIFTFCPIWTVIKFGSKVKFIAEISNSIAPALGGGEDGGVGDTYIVGETVGDGAGLGVGGGVAVAEIAGSFASRDGDGVAFGFSMPCCRIRNPPMIIAIIIMNAMTKAAVLILFSSFLVPTSRD